MAAEIDIDAFRVFNKQRTTMAENQQKNKNSPSQLKIYRFKKKGVYLLRLGHF